MPVEVETPYSVAEVAALTGLSARTVTKLFEHERGVVVYETRNAIYRKRRYRTLRIPRHVYERVMRRYTR